ncbi:MAG: hypothetical protein AcusKO_29180 [Acuticoccus sp.]
MHELIEAVSQFITHFGPEKLAAVVLSIGVFVVTLVKGILAGKKAEPLVDPMTKRLDEIEDGQEHQGDQILELAGSIARVEGEVKVLRSLIERSLANSS